MGYFHKMFVKLTIIGVLIGMGTSLAPRESYNRRFSQCFSLYSTYSNNPLTFGQTVPYGSTLSSLISKIEKLEYKLSKTGPVSPMKTALTLLHWFAYPDAIWHNGNPHSKPETLHRYTFIERLFRDELYNVADTSFEVIMNDRADTMDDRQMDDFCFLMFGLSHAINVTMPEDSSGYEGVNKMMTANKNYLRTLNANPRSNFNNMNNNNNNNNMRNKNDFNSNNGRSSGRSNQDQNIQSRSQDRSPRPYGSQQQSTYKVKANAYANPEDRLASNVGAQKATFSAHERFYREFGVVSISGELTDAISLAPVLMGIAAARMQKVPLFEPSERSYVREEMEGVPMATLGQEIGYAAFKRRQTQINTPQKSAEVGSKGFWFDPGCLTSFILGKSDDREILLSRAQLLGAVDGYIIGKFLEDNNDLDKWSLSRILRFYYSDNKTPLGKTNVALSVCERRNTFQTMAKDEVAEQGKLMAYGLAVKDGKTFMDSTQLFSDQMVSYDNPEIGGAVSGVLGDVDTHVNSAADDLNDVFCRSSLQDQCDTPSHIFLILDSSAAQMTETKDMQARLVAGIFNREMLRKGRNAISVFASKRQGNLLMSLLPPPSNSENTDTRSIYNTTGSGCPACIAQFMDRVSTTGGYLDSDALPDVFLGLNDTFRTYKDFLRQNPVSGLPSRVVVFMYLRDEPIKNLDQAAQYLNSFYVTNPEVTIIGVGIKKYLEDLNEKSGALHVFDSQELLNDIVNMPYLNRQHISELKKAICQASANLQNEACQRDESSTDYRENRMLRSGSDVTTFHGGVGLKKVEFWAYDPSYFAGSRDARVKFTSESGFIKVCEASSGYDFSQGGANNDRCQTTSNELKSVYFNYTYPCKNGKYSCSPLKYAIVGLPATTSANRQMRTTPSTTNCVMCESPFASRFSVEPEGFRCSSTSLVVSSGLILLMAILNTLGGQIL